MTRLHRTIPERLRAIRTRVRRAPAPPAARAATPSTEGFGDLSGLIFYGQG